MSFAADKLAVLTRLNALISAVDALLPGASKAAILSEFTAVSAQVNALTPDAGIPAPIFVTNKAVILGLLDQARVGVEALVPDVVVPPPAPPPEPTITGFAASPAALPVGGGSVTLNAVLNNVVSLKLDGVPVGLPTTIALTTTRLFSLVGTGVAGTTPVTVTLTVNVAAAPSDVPVVVVETMNPHGIVASNSYCLASGNYERFQTQEEWVGNSITIGFGGKNGHAIVGGTYTLRIRRFEDEVEVASVSRVIPAGLTYSAFLPLSIASLTEGWYLYTITAPTGESFPTWAAYRYIDGTTTPPRMPAFTGTFETMAGGAPHRWAKMPTTYTPVAKPLPMRNYVTFNTAELFSNLYLEMLAPIREGYIRRPNFSSRHVLNTFNFEAYHFSTLTAPRPAVNLMDGPRGIGTIVMATHVMGGRNHKTYTLEPWRGTVTTADGTVTTLFGWAHNSPPGHYDDPSQLRLVGDWSAVTVKGLHEAWDWTWDPDSLASDPDGVPIGGELPHINIGPVAFIADTQNNRVLRMQANGGGDAGFAVFGNRDRSAPWKITEFLTGMSDVWGVQCRTTAHGGELFVGTRGDHKIRAYNKTTGALIRTLVAGPAMSHVDVNRFVVRDATLATIQAQACVGPEGLALLEGPTAADDEIFFGSKAMEQIRSMPADSNNATTTKLICSPPIDGNSRFMKIAVCKGNDGPRRAVGVTTWSTAQLGFPMFYVPNANPALPHVGWKVFEAAHFGQGRGGRWSASGEYAGAVGFLNDGRIAFGGSAEGLAIISKTLPTDDPTAPDYNKYERGETLFLKHSLLHGERGYGFHGFPLPFGEDSDLDYYLTVNGHAP